MSFKQVFFLWGPVVIWCGIIFTFSSLPNLPKTTFIWWDFILKKTAHMIEYAILFFLLWRALRQNYEFKKNKLNIYLLTFLFCLLYAASDEFHQSFVIGRTATIRDVGFDFLGMLFSWQAVKQRLA